MKFEVEKYHALGNDYIIFDPNKNELDINEKVIRTLCSRHYGVGADGLLLGPVFEGNTVTVRIYNPDGSEAEISGNGISIFAKYMKDADYIQKSHMRFRTLGGEVEAFYENEEGSRLKITMGKLSFWSDDIPVTGERREVVNEQMEFNYVPYLVTCVSVGNPHCIIPVEELSKEEVCHIGRYSQYAPCFPNRINTQLMKVLDKNNIQIETYERGAGYTLAAGSNACAAAGAAYKLGMTEPKMYVHMPGGTLQVEIEPDWRVMMTGEVFHIGKMKLSYSFSEKLRSL